MSENMASQKQVNKICWELGNAFYHGDASMGFVEERMTAYQAYRVIELFERNQMEDGIKLLEEYYRQAGGKARDDRRNCEWCKKGFEVSQYAPYATKCRACYKEWKEAKESGNFDDHYDVMDPKERQLITNEV